MEKIIFTLTIFLVLSACIPPKSDPEPIPSGNPQNVTTVAGSGNSGSSNGTVSTALFNAPRGLTVDASGNVYVADYDNHVIRKIEQNGSVITLAGSGSPGFTNAKGVLASFNHPRDVAVDSYGSVFVVDCENHCIRKITLTGYVSTFAGTGSAGSTDGPGAAASFKSPSGITIDYYGTLYITDSGNHLIRKITPYGEVTTLAGTGSAGSVNGTGTAASFNNPFGIALGNSLSGFGYIVVADQSNNLIRKITFAGVVTTFAGSGSAGSDDGQGMAASFNNPYGITADHYGNVYVTNCNTHTIRKINSTGDVTTLAGTGNIGFANAMVINASFNFPTGIVVDRQGSLYISDSGNNTIRKISY